METRAGVAGVYEAGAQGVELRPGKMARGTRGLRPCGTDPGALGVEAQRNTTGDRVGERWRPGRQDLWGDGLREKSLRRINHLGPGGHRKGSSERHCVHPMVAGLLVSAPVPFPSQH